MIPAELTPPEGDIAAVRSHVLFPETGRIVTDNAASPQPPRELLSLYRSRRATTTSTGASPAPRRP